MIELTRRMELEGMEKTERTCCEVRTKRRTSIRKGSAGEEIDREGRGDEEPKE